MSTEFEGLQVAPDAGGEVQPAPIRQKFEEWAFLYDYDTTRSTCGSRSGLYASEATQRAWNAWQHFAREATQPSTTPAPQAGSLEPQELEDLAHSAFEEAMAFGVSADSFHRLAKTVAKRLLATAPAVAVQERGKCAADIAFELRMTGEPTFEEVLVHVRMVYQDRSERIAADLSRPNMRAAPGLACVNGESK